MTVSSRSQFNSKSSQLTSSPTPLSTGVRVVGGGGGVGSSGVGVPPVTVGSSVGGVGGGSVTLGPVGIGMVVAGSFVRIGSNGALVTSAEVRGGCVSFGAPPPVQETNVKTVKRESTSRSSFIVFFIRIPSFTHVAARSPCRLPLPSALLFSLRSGCRFPSDNRRRSRQTTPRPRSREYP